MKKILLVLIALFLMSPQLAKSQVFATNEFPWWKIQSVDTMKYSRDMSRQILGNPTHFEPVIDHQIKEIANTGATHVGISTPYDEEFVPVLQHWVTTARRHGLKVWFRGNFSGWEGWFDYPDISREEHKAMTVEFIRTHAYLFEDGDIFSPCPECENGGPGDPRHNGDVEGHREFLIDLYKDSRQAMHSIGKKVDTNLHSMNGDVARLIMDEETTKELGGVITIDHYVNNIDKLATDIKELARRSHGKIVLGEFGAPIPGIHHEMTPAEQSAWLEQNFSQLARMPEVIGINYWVNTGGSTALWKDDGTAMEGVKVLKKYYNPKVLRGRVVDFDGYAVPDATIKTAYRTVYTDQKGQFAVPYIGAQDEMLISEKGFFSKKIVIGQYSGQDIELEYEPMPLPQTLSRMLRNFFRKISSSLFDRRSQ